MGEEIDRVSKGKALAFWNTFLVVFDCLVVYCYEVFDYNYCFLVLLDAMVKMNYPDEIALAKVAKLVFIGIFLLERRLLCTKTIWHRQLQQLNKALGRPIPIP
jgi:hypothetical protein